MSSQSGTASITIADEATLRARTPPPVCEIALVEATYAYSSPQGSTCIHSLNLSGLAWGASSIEVRASEPQKGLDVGGQAQVNVRGEWTITLDLAADPWDYGALAVLQMEARAPASCGARATNVAILGLPDVAGAVGRPAEGTDSGFEGERSRYTAGHPDRFVPTRSYVPLICSYFVPPPGWVWEPPPGQLAGERQFELQRQFTASAARTGRDFQAKLIEPNSIDLDRVYRLMGQVYDTFVAEIRNEVKNATVPTRPNQGNAKAAASYTVNAAGGVQLAVPYPPPAGPPLDYRTLLKDSLGLRYTAFGSPVGVQSGIGMIRYINLGWLGIMFHDRLRFRAHGLVTGEQVYSLGLAPGEEVTLTQTSETKRNRSFEQVLDQEEERTLEFSSTWSTTLLQQDVVSETFTFGENLGGNLGVPVAEAVTAGGSAGVNAQMSSAISATRQRIRGTEATARYTAKAREQHKTTFKVSTDLTESFGSKRVLRNPNPTRALTLHFHKLYQKYRVLLERNDAKLCCALYVTDPGAGLRAELTRELDKLDPQVSLTPSANCPKLPEPGEREQGYSRDTGSAIGSYAEFTFEYTLPQGTVLADNSLENCFRIKRWLATDLASDLAGTGRFDRAPDRFRELGGSWEYVGDPPQVGSPGPQNCTVKVTVPRGPLWITVNINVSFMWKYIPSAAMTAEVQACVEDQKQNLRETFSMDKVLQVVDEVKSGFREYLLMAVEEQLLPGFDLRSTDPPGTLLDDIRNLFEWDELAMEYLPWWLTASGRSAHDALRDRLRSLPDNVRSSIVIKDWLVASSARVYLPVKPGREKDILWWAALDDESRKYVEETLDDFVDWRHGTFAAVPYTPPTYEQVMAPVPAVGTPAGSAAWMNGWEKPRRKFLVLDEWAELLPTDGVHVEPVLSTGGAADAYRTSSLITELDTAAAQNRFLATKSAAAESETE